MPTQSIVDNNSAAPKIAKNLSLFGMSYVVYLITIPLVLFFFFMIALALVMSLMPFTQINPTPAFAYLKAFSLFPENFSLNLHIDGKQILEYFSIITLVIAVISNVLNYIYKKKFEIALKPKLKALLISILICYGYIFVMAWFFVSKDLGYIFVLGIFFVLTILNTLLWFGARKLYSAINEAFSKIE